MIETELKTCPCCRSQADLMELWGAVLKPTARIACSECGINIEVMIHFWEPIPEAQKEMKKAVKEAVKIWNTRK